MARILIVGGGCRGRRLAGELVAAGQAVRVTTRAEGRRAQIESDGAECWVGTPDRLETMRGVLDGVAIACWMLAQAHGPPQEVGALHGSRLAAFARQVIDSTVRGFIYDASGGALPAEMLAEGERIVRSVSERNAIPARVLACGEGAGAADADWVTAARAVVESLLGGSG